MNDGSAKRFKLTKKQIIKHNQDFRDILSSGTFFKSQHFTLAARTSLAENIRIGFTVQRGIKSAVKRNRIKRRCRELARIHQHLLTLQVDIILIAKESVYATPFYILKSDFVWLLKRLNTYKSFQ